MRTKMNSYGKTWHVWNTGHEGFAADQLPLGPAMLAWSFNRDGEALPSLVEKRDRCRKLSREARDWNHRMLAGVGVRYGMDSLEYEQAGGTRTSKVRRARDQKKEGQ